MSDICAVHLGSKGLEFTSTRDALVEFKAAAQKALVAGLVQDAATERAALDQLRSKRFFHFTDGSFASKDVRDDGDMKRRSRWLSITRDMMQGPSWDGAHSQALFHRDNASIPIFGQREGAGVDGERFVDEVNKLIARRILDASDFPDLDSDESMIELFGKIHVLALNDAEGKRVDLGTKNKIIDAAPGLYLFSELLNRSNIIVEEDFTELWARRIFSIRNLNTWMPQWLFQRMDTRGVLPSYVNVERLPSSSPRGSENRDGEVRNLAFCHHGASWSKLELMRWAEAQSNGAPSFSIDRSRIDTAVRMMNFKEDLTVFFGDEDVDILGLFSDEAKTKIRRVASGGQFGAGGTDDDRNLLTREVKKIRENTETVLQPDTIMLSLRSWDYVVDTPYGTPDSGISDETVLTMAEKSLRRLGIKDVLMVPEVGYSAAQEQRLVDHDLLPAQAQKYSGGIGDQLQSMVVCNREAHVMEMIVAKDRVMYPSQETRTDRVETRMLQGGGGLAVYKPAGATIVTDVGPAA